LPKRVASRAAVAEYFKGLEGFKKYMREHLRQRMGDEWDKRHNKHSHTRRDISRDKIRYEYHTGILDLDRYEYTEDQKHILRHCPEVADQHFAWG